MFAICAFTVLPSFAQFDTAEVLGTVRDKTGAVVPKAALTLLNVDTGIQAKTTADENGNYTFSNVKIGTLQSDRRSQRLFERKSRPISR